MDRTSMKLSMCALSLVMAACAAHKTTAEPPQPAGHAIAAGAVADTPTGKVTEGLVSISATVEAVNLKKRIVTLRGPEGRVVDLEVGEEVKNLPQVHKGDTVVATYYESIAIEVKKPGEAQPGITTAEDVRTAKLGEKPAMTGAHQTTVTATVVGLNKAKSEATLKGPRGRTVTVAVKDPKKLDNVKVGDLVEVTYTEALAISVEKPEKAKR